VIILHQEQPREMESTVTEKGKRISCTTITSMAGDVLMPLLVIHWKTIDRGVWEEG
jgi:hypothetical protein